MRKKHIVAPCLTAGVFLALMAPAWAEPAVECGSLNEPGLFTDTLVTSAALVREKDGVPEHCRVTGVIQPTPGSRIGVEFRLPNEWNGKFLGIGGGGFGGQIRTENFSDPLKRGYASAQTDIGHSANDDEWPIYGPGLPNEDAVRDYAWRSFHLMTVVGKQAAEHYGGRSLTVPTGSAARQAAARGSSTHSVSLKAMTASSPVRRSIRTGSRRGRSSATTCSGAKAQTCRCRPERCHW